MLWIAIGAALINMIISVAMYVKSKNVYLEGYDEGYFKAYIDYRKKI